MPRLKLIKTTAEALAHIEQLSRMQFQTELLYTKYWKAGRFHDDKEREELDRIITDLRCETALLLQQTKRDYCESANGDTIDPELRHATAVEPNIRFKTNGVPT
jgi:hypothetical protein